MANWGDDDLTRFLDAVRSNQIAHRSKFVAPYELIARVNNCLSTAGKNLVNPSPVIAGVLLLRAQYAYKAAAGMALAGQIVETFPMMRLGLEYAGYALTIFSDTQLETVFLSRHTSTDAMKINKQKFKVSEIKGVISTFDRKLADVFDDLYQRTIDFGGHPNPHAVLSAAQLDTDIGANGITALALSTDERTVLHAIRSVSQVGLTILLMFQHIFTAKFELLGIRAEIDRLRNENL